MIVRVACVVEGHGDVEAVPVIIQRIAQEIQLALPLEISRPIRIPRSRLIKPGELENAVELAARQVRGDGGVVVVLDSDDDCAKELGPELLGRARAVRNNVPVTVVLATREVESWFIAAAASIAGCCGLQRPLPVPADPEGIRGAKEWLAQRMEGGRVYSPTLDQPELARVFDLQAACTARSFSKFRRDVRRILETTVEALQNRPPLPRP